MPTANKRECLQSSLYIKWLCSQAYITKYFSLTPGFSSYLLHDNNCPYVGCTSQLQQQFNSTCISFYTIYYNIATNIIHISSRYNVHVMSKVDIYKHMQYSFKAHVCSVFKMVCIAAFFKHLKHPSRQKISHNTLHNFMKSVIKFLV